MLAVAVSGLLTGLSLIVAIGAQNAYVLRQGLLRSHVGLVVAICIVSDAILIVAGVSGVGTVIAHASWLLSAVRWFGVAFLVCYAAATLHRAARHRGALDAGGPGGGAPDGSARAKPAAAGVAGRTVALTWLNPHVYLDTVLLVGSIANSHGPHGRWWFAVGAVLASTVWFAGLGFGAGLLNPVLSRPRAWQVLDVLIALTMLAVAAELAVAAVPG